MAQGKNQHVVKHHDGWAVKGAERWSGLTGQHFTILKWNVVPLMPRF